MKSTILLVVLAIIALIIAAPLLFIWSLNTLFPVLAIPYTLETWAAAVLLNSALITATGARKSK